MQRDHENQSRQSKFIARDRAVGPGGSVFVYGLIGLDRLHLDGEMDTLRPDYTGVGIANYQAIFAQNRFLMDIRNTVVFTIFFIAASLTIGLTLANLIDRQIRSEGLFRNIFVFPMAVSFIVTGVVWNGSSTGSGCVRRHAATPEGLNQLFGLDPASNRWLTDAHVVYIGPDNPVYGILHDIGLGSSRAPTSGYRSPPVDRSGCCLADVGLRHGSVLAGLRAIPEELKEAAEWTAAPSGRSFRHIVFPLLTPSPSRDDHPRPHQPEDLRPDSGHVRIGPRLCHGHARPLHVADGIP